MLTRKRMLLAAGAIVIIAVAIFGIVRFTDRDPGGESAIPTATAPAEKAVPAPTGIAPSEQPTPAAVPSMDPAAATKEAQAAIRAYIELSDQSYAQTGLTRTVADGLADVATGRALGRVQSNLSEQAVAAYHQKGTSSVSASSVQETKLDQVPPTMTIGVCRDQSKVAFVYDSGGDAGGPSIEKVKEIYSMSYLDGKWMVADVAMPNDPRC